MRTERPRASLTSVPAHDPRIPQRGATHTKIGPPRRARVDARDARERTSHGPRSASNASAAAAGGRSGRRRVRPRARHRGALAPKNHPKLPFPPHQNLPRPQKIIQNFPSPPTTTHPHNEQGGCLPPHFVRALSERATAARRCSDGTGMCVAARAAHTPWSDSH